jgi:hypothetical protein
MSTRPVHGHTFQLAADGPRKDTAIVLPGRTVTPMLDVLILPRRTGVRRLRARMTMTDQTMGKE